MVTGAGPKALCAGGDVAALALQNEKGPEGQQQSTDFFGLEYTLDHTIATYTKPFISVMDGITMGGGVGLSVHAPFRIATENTLFAMPETTIGFFPDVGGSFFLPRLDGQIGTYLALTSERLRGAQALYAGVATHYFHSSVLSNLTGRLSELVFRDSAPLEERLDLVNKTMAEYSTGLPSQREEPMLLAGSLREAIDRCFSFHTMEQIFQALEKETQLENGQKEWAQKTLETLSARSPTSLKVALRQMRVGRKWSISETFQREHHLAGKFMRHPDFVEGVKARLMSKPPRQAAWQPATLAEIKSEDVDAFFAIPEGETRLPLLSDTDYYDYPHAHYGLPSQKEIEQFVMNASGDRREVVNKFLAQWGNKEGVRQKLSEVLARCTISRGDGTIEWKR